MKTIIFLLAVITVLVVIQPASIANPVYELTAQNFALNCGEYDTLEWDIYMRNPGPEPLYFANGQFVFNYTPSIANGGTLLFRIVSTDLPPQVSPTAPSISGSTLRFSTNVAVNPADAYLISTGFPGTKIARVRLITRATTFSGNSFYPSWKDTLPGAYTKVSAYVGTTFTQINSSNKSIVEQNCGMFTNSLWECCNAKLLSLTSAIEGLYDSALNKLNSSDTVTVDLRDEAYPHTLRYSAKCRYDSINLSSFHVFTIPTTPSNYYLVIRHRNSIETWSNSTVSLARNGEITSYNTTLSATSAYGNNLKLKGTKYCIYSGDVNQDKVVNLSDVLLTYNDAQNFVTGYVNSDLNGDNVVNLSDITIVSNNSALFVRAITPLN